ncbi:MAG: hypothetical protein ABJA80_07785 [bacterium]
MRLPFRTLVVAALASIAACSATTAPIGPALAGDLQGQWAAKQTFPGNSLVFALHAADSTVAGTGTFSGEAGPSGTVFVDGSVSGGTVTLHFAYTATVPVLSNSTARFIGTLDADGRLVGSMKYGPDAGMQPESTIEFARIDVLHP